MSEDASSDRTDPLSDGDQRRAVRNRYAEIATDPRTSCGDTEETTCCDGADGGTDHAAQSRQVGYTQQQVETAPSEANLGLGCGNPTAIADLEAGETVLDLGSGGGFDCLLAAQEVGESGQVIGVDMTPEMVEKARKNAADTSNVEFRLGEIEHLPVADATVDVIISNCVINLSPEKQRVFAEAFRVLRPGGRLAISDVVLTSDLPTGWKSDPESISACVGGASSISALETMLREAGFVDIDIEPKADSDEFIREWDPERDLSEYIVSAVIEGRKPET